MQAALGQSQFVAIEMSRVPRPHIPLDRAIARPYDTRSLVYLVTLRDEDDPKSVFLRDAHQEIRNVEGKTFELVVHPVRADSARTDEDFRARLDGVLAETPVGATRDVALGEGVFAAVASGSPQAIPEVFRLPEGKSALVALLA